MCAVNVFLLSRKVHWTPASFVCWWMFENVLCVFVYKNKIATQHTSHRHRGRLRLIWNERFKTRTAVFVHCASLRLIIQAYEYSHTYSINRYVIVQLHAPRELLFKRKWITASRATVLYICVCVCMCVCLCGNKTNTQSTPRAGPSGTNIFGVLKRGRYIDLFTPFTTLPNKAPAWLAVALI